MNQPQHGKHADHSHHPHKASKSHWSKDWRLWTAVILMLAAMGIYVATFDESIEPGAPVEPETPAAVGP